MHEPVAMDDLPKNLNVFNCGPGCRATTPDLIVFSVLAGTLATFTLGYNFGINNHVELLLPILRQLDPGFCPGDFAVNATSGYEVRFYFSWMCALLARILSLPGAMLALALVQNVGMALVTALAARDMHGRATAAPLAAAALVLAVESIQLGQAGFLRQPYGWPAVFGLVWALAALWQGLRLRPWVALGFAMVAALFHPLVGLETGGIGLGICGISALCAGALDGASRRKMALRSALALGGLILFALLVWGPVQEQDGMTVKQFIDVYARFRVPHHVLPSYFPGRDYGFMLAFLVASGISWHWWRRSPGADSRWVRGIPIGSAMVLALLLGGWIFIEVLPSRLWAILQTFRLVYVLKWFGLLLFAGTIGRAWASKEKGARASGWLLFLPVGQGEPLAALWAHGIEWIRRWIPHPVGRWAVPLLAALGFMGLYWIVSAWLSPQTAPELFTLLALLVVVACFRTFRCSWLRHGVSLLWTAAVIGTLLVNRACPLPVVGEYLGRFNPIFTLADACDPVDRVALFCRDRLPAEAVVLTPPLEGRFRLVAERAIVVDFKCPTTRDSTMLEWRKRMVDCYGVVEEGGFGAVRPMERNYRRMTDERRMDLARRYGATHALLFPETVTRFEVLYEDPLCKLVRIPSRADAVPAPE